MFWQNQKYVLSQRELLDNVIHCPACSSILEPKATSVFLGLVCGASNCSFSADLDSIENLPTQVVSAFQESLSSHIDIEDMKGVVDELIARGSHDIASELSSVILANTSSSVVSSAEEVEALRLINFVQAQSEQDADLQKLSARLAILKAELTWRK